MKTKESKAAYDTEYNRQHIRRVLIPFNDQKTNDMKMLEWLNQPGRNKTEYIKRLIREDMDG